MGTRLSSVCLLLAAASLVLALDWTETGGIPAAVNIDELVVGPGGDLFAAVNTADSGFVYRSTDGYNWSRCGLMPGFVQHVYALIAGSGDTLLAGTRATFGGGDSGHLYSSPDGGATWQHRSSFGGLVVGRKMTVLLEDDSGYIYAGHDYFDGSRAYPPCRSTDRGYTWTQAPSITPYSAYQYTLLQASDGTIYCGSWGYRGLVMKSTDHGASWTATGELFDAGYTTSLVEGPGAVLYACTYPKVVPQEPVGRVFKTTNQGGDWTEVGHGYFSATTGLRPLCVVSDSELYVASEPNGAVFTSTDYGATWANAGNLPGTSVTYRMRQVHIDGDDYLYATTGQNGKVFRAPLGPVGTSERTALGALRPAPAATIARGVLRMPLSPFTLHTSLFDLDGRKVLDLSPGPNDISRLAPGVYFVLSPATAGKIVIQR